MKAIKNLVEYYDELFPVTESQKSFFRQFSNQDKTPLKILRLSCGTGLFETTLSREGHDVTGIETCDEFLRAANMRRRSQLMSIRFFSMTSDDMIKYLGKKFYNIISILNSRIIFKSREEIVTLFETAKQLIADNGTLIIQMLNFEDMPDKEMIQLPIRESMRVKMFSELWNAEDKGKTLNINIEIGSGKILPVIKNIPVYPITPSEIEKIAEETGWSSAEFFADYDRTPFSGNEESFVVLIR